jgi:uncharacterized membrane protein
MSLVRSLAPRLSLAAFVFAAGCGGSDGGGSGTGGGLATGNVCPPGGTTLAYSGGSGPADFAKTFFDGKCVLCHDSAKSGLDRNGAPVGANFDTLAGIRGRLALIDARAALGPTSTVPSMPPSTAGVTVVDADRQRLGEWLACGAP